MSSKDAILMLGESVVSFEVSHVRNPASFSFDAVTAIFAA